MSKKIEENKGKLERYKTIGELIKSESSNAYIKKYLNYKNWVLYVFKNKDKFYIKIIQKRQKKTYQRLNLAFEDIDEVVALINAIKDSFKKYGIKPMKL